MRNGKPKRPIPQWLVDWLADRPALKSVDSDFGTVTSSSDPQEEIQRIDCWLEAHPEIAGIPQIAKAYQKKRRAALKRGKATKS
jgi:hypothetical protein